MLSKHEGVIELDEITFRPGKYSAAVNQPAKLKAEVTVNYHQITDLKLKSLDNNQPMDKDMAATFKGQVLKNQSVNIDGVTAASLLTKAVKSAVGDAVAQARE